MSHVISLLSDSHWQGARLKSLLASRAIPHADRISASGPDIIVSARAAQSLSLLLFARGALFLQGVWSVVEADALLLGVRLRRAALALTTTRQTIASIAFEAGFGDISTFNAHFRRAFGNTPSALRGPSSN